MPVPDLPQRPAARPTDDADFAGMMEPSAFSAEEIAPRLAVGPNEPFFLRHHPGNWFPSRFLEGGPFWLPEITVHVLAPGVNGVRTRDKHEPVEAGYRNSVRDGEDHGWVYLSPRAEIPAECLPPGVPSGGYLRDVACQDPRTLASGRRYLEAWQVPAQTVPGEPQRFVFHHESHERWLAWLVRSGLIAPMAPYVAERLARRYTDRIERAQMLNLSPEVRTIRVERASELAARFTEAKVLPAEEPAPTPSPSSKTSKRRSA